MAIKGWKKLKGMDRWESNNDQIDVGRVKDRWRVVSIYGKFDDKWFKSKTEAMKFAKKYMKDEEEDYPSDAYPSMEQGSKF